MKIKPEKELIMIRGKLVCGCASKKEIVEFLKYVGFMESLVVEATNEDFYGTEGWRPRIGWGNG